MEELKKVAGSVAGCSECGRKEVVELDAGSSGGWRAGGWLYGARRTKRV
jgi:hypothetical protein